MNNKEILLDEGYKIFDIDNQCYLGDKYSFIANYENAHNKLLFYRRHSAWKNGHYEIHKFKIFIPHILKLND